jgi:hypothetical protein
MTYPEAAHFFSLLLGLSSGFRIRSGGGRLGSRGDIVLLILEFRVLVLNVLVQRLDEQVVDLLREINLRHLQLGQIIRHHCIVEVRQHHRLQQLHIALAELTDALVYDASNVGVLCLLASQHVVNVFFALSEVINQSREIEKHNLTVGHDLLVLDDLTQLFHIDVAFLLKNCHRV